jgi:hypothetical protein
METKALPKEVEDLKFAIRKLIEDFNAKTGLTISGVIAEAELLHVTDTNTPVAKTYHVGISIDL